MLPESYIRHVLDETLPAPPKVDLTECPAVSLTREQERIFGSCISHARALGLRLPRPVRVRFVFEPGEHAGQARLGFDESIRVSINLAECRGSRALAATSFHELFHVHEFVSGDSVGRFESERRANQFSSWAIESWRS